MNKRMISLMAAALALLSASGQVEFSGGMSGVHPTIEIKLSDNHTSLNRVYVVYDTEGVSMSFNSSTGEPAKWENYYYHNGERVTEPISDVRWNGMATTLDKIIPNKGYIITEGNTPFYCWVVNYADYELELNDMFINDEAPCSLLSFNIDGHGDAIPYYEINGHRYVLDREINLTYNTLVWNDSTHWQEEEVVESFAALDQSVEVLPPLCNTMFSLSGDRFLREWDIDEVRIDEVYYKTHAVGCGSNAFLVNSQGEETRLDGELMDGSAPVHILFKGYPTDEVAYRKWEMATDADFENVILQWNQDEVDYTFIDSGTYYMRYMVANDVGSCEAYGDPYTIDVAISSVGVGERGELPNVFSPGSTPGVNDTWKVPHKSLIEFHCWIFNRWGTLIYEFTDPDGEWDGTYQGKIVDTGVYYCVVTATGSDGKKYKKRGSITVMRYKRGVSGASGGMPSGELGN